MTLIPLIIDDGGQTSLRWGLFYLLVMYTQIPYNVYMKIKQIHIRIDEEFEKKLQYLMRIHGFKSMSDTIRILIEKEYRKETEK